MESQTLDAARSGAIEGIVLRYGLFYGPGNPATDDLIARVRRRGVPRVRNDQGQLPYIHLDDAVSATIAALDHGVSGGVYDIVDDRPTSFSEMVTELASVAGAPTPRTLPAWVLRLAGAVSRAPVHDAAAALERKGEAGARMGADVPELSRRIAPDDRTRGVATKNTKIRPRRTRRSERHGRQRVRTASLALFSLAYRMLGSASRLRTWCRMRGCDRQLRRRRICVRRARI
jgi:hypothetical protein